MTKPTISRETFVNRRNSIQTLLCSKEMDLLIAYADDRFTYGQAYARWICDYVPQFESALILVPAKGTTIIATGAESEEYARTYAKDAQPRIADIFLHPDEEYVYATVLPFEKIIGELEDHLDRKIRKIGIAGFDLIPYKLYQALLQSFPDTQFINIESDIMKLRAVKSPDEIRVIEYAYQIAQAGMNAALEALQPGKTEREIAARAEYAMRSMGSEGMGIMTMVASGFEHTRPILATTTNRVIEKGDLVCMTFAPRYEGYHGAIARPVVLGKPSVPLQKALDAAKRAQHEAQALLRPGVSGCEVDAVTRQILGEAGFGKNFAYSAVHSVGVVEFESPIMNSGMTETIQKDMVFSIDIPIFFNDDFGGFRIENGFLITEDGHRALNDLSVHDQKY